MILKHSQKSTAQKGAWLIFVYKWSLPFFREQIFLELFIFLKFLFIYLTERKKALAGGVAGRGKRRGA